MQELIPIVAIFFVIGVPVMSIAARFVLRPLLKDFAQAIGRGPAKEGDELQQRLARLEKHLLEQGRQLDQLVDAELFRRELETRAEGVSRLRARPTTAEPAPGDLSASGH